MLIWAVIILFFNDSRIHLQLNVITLGALSERNIIIGITSVPWNCNFVTCIAHNWISLPSLLTFIAIISGFFADSKQYLLLRVLLFSFIAFHIRNRVVSRQTFTIFRDWRIISLFYGLLRFLELYIIMIDSILIASVHGFIAVSYFFSAKKFEQFGHFELHHVVDFKLRLDC